MVGDLLSLLIVESGRGGWVDLLGVLIVEPLRSTLNELEVPAREATFCPRLPPRRQRRKARLCFRVSGFGVWGLGLGFGGWGLGFSGFGGRREGGRPPSGCPSARCWVLGLRA